MQCVQHCFPLPASAKATKLLLFLYSSFFPLQLPSSTAKKENGWKLGFSCLLCITDPLLDVKICVVLIQPYILELTVLVDVSQPGRELPAALAQLEGACDQ